MEQTPQPTTADIAPLARLTKDLKEAAATLSKDEARFLVDAYYQMQENRKRAKNQVRALSESEEPHAVLLWLAHNNQLLEGRIKIALDVYSESSEIGRWSRSVVGIGPVIAAGLIAHIDIERAPTAGHIWVFAGLSDDVAWMGGKAAEKAVGMFADLDTLADIDTILKVAEFQRCSPKWLARRVYRAATGLDIPFRGLNRETEDHKYVGLILGGSAFTKKHIVEALSKRPWNARLKTLCWKIGESFVKKSGSEGCVYGKIYAERKTLETARNVAGLYADQASAVLANKKIGKTTFAYLWYAGCLKPAAMAVYEKTESKHREKAVRETAGEPGSGQPMLPPAHVHARAKRYAVKLFISGWHEAAYFAAFKRLPPNPYPIAILGHAHYISAPNMGVVPGWGEARAKAKI